MNPESRVGTKPLFYFLENQGQPILSDYGTKIVIVNPKLKLIIECSAF